MIKTLEEIDKIRRKGFRPQVVGCFLNSGRLLLVYKKEHDLWQLPQGGIDNRETMKEALVREMKEELGEKFINANNQNISLISEAKVEFPANKQDVRNLQTDDGETIMMKGKKYFFLKAIVAELNIDIGETEFDDYVWVSYEEGMALAKKIYQKGKKRVTIKVLKRLRELGLIS